MSTNEYGPGLLPDSSEVSARDESFNLATDTVYGSVEDDAYLLRNAESLPRFAHLARKALLHYAGDRYNPHRHARWIEPFIREIIQRLVSYKILFRTPGYDWEWIDHTLRKAIGGTLEIDIPYSQDRIDAGFKGDSKAVMTIDETVIH